MTRHVTSYVCRPFGPKRKDGSSELNQLQLNSTQQTNQRTTEPDEAPRQRGKRSELLPSIWEFHFAPHVASWQGFDGFFVSSLTCRRPGMDNRGGWLARPASCLIRVSQWWPHNDDGPRRLRRDVTPQLASAWLSPAMEHGAQLFQNIQTIPD